MKNSYDTIMFNTEGINDVLIEELENSGVSIEGADSDISSIENISVDGYKTKTVSGFLMIRGLDLYGSSLERLSTTVVCDYIGFGSDQSYTILYYSIELSSGERVYAGFSKRPGRAMFFSDKGDLVDYYSRFKDIIASEDEAAMEDDMIRMFINRCSEDVILLKTLDSF